MPVRQDKPQALQPKNNFDPVFNFFDGTLRQPTDFLAEGFIGHSYQLTKQQITVAIKGSCSLGKSVAQDARVLDQFTGRRNHDRGWITGLIHQVGLYNQRRTKLSRLGLDPWVEVNDVEMPAFDVHLRIRRIATNRRLSKFTMLPLVGSGASADRFFDLFP